MISSTTLLVATLVFNALSSLGAPIRIPAGESVVARAEISEPVLRRAAFVEIEPRHTRSNLGEFTRRSVRLPREPELETRDSASPIPEIDTVVRRYPRAHLYNFYEKRSPAPGDVSDEPQFERRFPRQALHARHVKRQEETPAKAADGTSPSPAGAEDPAATASPSAADADASPSVTASDAAASPSDAAATPAATTTAAEDAGATTTASPTATDSSSTATPTSTESAASTETASETASATTTGTSPSAAATSVKADAPVVTSTAAASTSTSTSTSPVIPAIPVATSKADQATDIAGIVNAIEKNNGNGGFQNGQTTKETTVIVSKVTYNSDANKDKPVVSATTVTLGQPSPSSSSTPAAAAVSPPAEAAPSPSATSTESAAGAATPPEDTPAAAEASPSPAPVEAEPRSVFRRNLGFSGAAYASLLKRSLDLD